MRVTVLALHYSGGLLRGRACADFPGLPSCVRVISQHPEGQALCLLPSSCPGGHRPRGVHGTCRWQSRGWNSSLTPEAVFRYEGLLFRVLSAPGPAVWDSLVVWFAGCLGVCWTPGEDFVTEQMVNAETRDSGTL